MKVIQHENAAGYSFMAVNKRTTALINKDLGLLF